MNNCMKIIGELNNLSKTMADILNEYNQKTKQLTMSLKQISSNSNSKKSSKAESFVKEEVSCKIEPKMCKQESKIEVKAEKIEYIN